MVVKSMGKITQKGARPFQGLKETRGNSLVNRYSAILDSALKNPFPSKEGIKRGFIS